MRAAALLIAMALTAAACGDSGTSTTAPPVAGGTVVLLTHDSFAVAEQVLAEFEAETGATVDVLRAGDAGSVVNQAILTKGAPLADAIFGVDNTFLSRAVEAGIFDPYESPLAAEVPDRYRLDPAVTPIDFGDVCVNYDIAALDRAGVPPPATLRDLIDPRYRGMLAVENPASSSPGLAFLLATIAAFPEGSEFGWPEYWAALRANDVLVTDGWEEAYYGAFSFSGGDRPLVVSYASSPPAEIVFAEGEPPTAVGTAVLADGCFRQIEFAGVLDGAANPELARRLVDFMLSKAFQEDVPLNMFVFPARSDADIPAVFLEHTVIPDDPASLPPDVIEERREEWIETWTRIVLR